ncbi:hypothetical protein NPX13_g8664 [Xylaria arbuscula]|uniref:Uncharacterized protein n=1 Tax=Xylaria arbuscula TaxID=114810 RepID=A0A9W8N884_9PEZI|nr:hypothetical protein NPX13_g8664 [Xylaria arbuscula]
MSSYRSLAATGLALLTATASVGALPFKLVARDPPQALPKKATDNDLKFQPAMDFDTDSCYNTPAIGPDGTINPGLDHNNAGLSVAIANFPFDLGHRNDWEHIAVWVQNGEAKNVFRLPKLTHLAGDYEIKAASDVRWDGTHPKMIYHKDGLSTHAFRFANADDDNIENATGAWFFGDLVSWNGFPSTDLRDKLSAYDFGSANFALKDSSYPGQLDNARDNLIPAFDINVDDGSPGTP